MRRERTPAIETKVRRGTNALRSPRPQIAKQNRSAEKPRRGAGDQCYARPPDEHAVFAQRGEAQGGRRRCALGTHHPTCLLWRVSNFYPKNHSRVVYVQRNRIQAKNKIHHQKSTYLGLRTVS